MSHAVDCGNGRWGRLETVHRMGEHRALQVRHVSCGEQGGTVRRGDVSGGGDRMDAATTARLAEVARAAGPSAVPPKPL